MPSATSSSPRRVAGLTEHLFAGPQTCAFCMGALRHPCLFCEQGKHIYQSSLGRVLLPLAPLSVPLWRLAFTGTPTKLSRIFLDPAFLLPLFQLFGRPVASIVDVERRTGSKWLFGLVAPVQLDVAVPQEDPRRFRYLAPGLPGLLVAPTFEDVDPLWVDRVGTDRQVKTAVLFPRPTDHGGERFHGR